jgi:apolipoprotein N-acyltransferase
VIGDDGTIEDAYDKIHLVPFGEYLPFERFFRGIGLRQMIALPGGFDAGTRRRTMTVASAPPFAPLICYEIIFPGAAVGRGDRPGWMVNVTNDAWFGDTPGPYQHLQQAVVRAVEEGLPLARAANSGISAIVDPYGRIEESLPLGTSGILDGTLPQALAATAYARYGDVLFLGMMVGFAVISAAGALARRANRN